MMKKLILFFAISALTFTSPAAHAFDLRGALQELANSATSTDSTSQNGSGLSGIAGAIGSLLGKTDIFQEDLVGTWKYCSPAIAFKSDNFLQKAGGAAASGVIEDKISGYYDKIGLNNLTLNFAADSTFTMSVKKIDLKGTIEKGDDGRFVFHFKALGKINLGRMSANIAKNGNNINVTFDVSKLIDLVSKVASITGNSTVTSLSKLLNSYDGLDAGFEMAKTASQPQQK